MRQDSRGPEERDRLHAVGRAISGRRKAAKQTQEDLAYGASLSLRHLQKIEAGETNLRLGTLFSIADHLGTTAHALLMTAAPRKARADGKRLKPGG